MLNEEHFKKLMAKLCDEVASQKTEEYIRIGFGEVIEEYDWGPVIEKTLRKLGYEPLPHSEEPQAEPGEAEYWKGRAQEAERTVEEKRAVIAHLRSEYSALYKQYAECGRTLTEHSRELGEAKAEAGHVKYWKDRSETLARQLLEERRHKNNLRGEHTELRRNCEAYHADHIEMRNKLNKLAHELGVRVQLCHVCGGEGILPGSMAAKVCGECHEARTALKEAGFAGY